MAAEARTTNCDRNGAAAMNLAVDLKTAEAILAVKGVQKRRTDAGLVPARHAEVVGFPPRLTSVQRLLDCFER